MKLCECGCRQEVNNRFVRGHQCAGKKLSDEHKQNVSNALKGKTISDEHKRKNGTDLCWGTIKFIESYAKAVWFPFESPKTHNPRGRVFIYLSVLQPALPFSLSYLENLGILKRFI